MDFFTQSTPEELQEKRAMLKYFFLIDIDGIIAKIKGSEEYPASISSKRSPLCSDKLFNLIFQTIIEATNEYTCILTSPGAHFFAESDLKPLDSPDSSSVPKCYRDAIYYLLQLSLRNHCIIHGSLHNPANIDSFRIRKKGNPSPNTIEICAAEHCFYEPDRKNHPDNIPQSYNQKYKRKIPDNFYSQQILKRIAVNISETDNHYFVPAPSSYFSFYLFYEDFVQKYNREIQKIDSHSTYRKSLFNAYNELCENSTRHSSHFDNNYCKLLFDYPLEYYYGFSSIPVLARCLENIHNCDTPNSLHPAHMKYMEGEQLLDIFKQVLQLPNVYSRGLFIQYAIQAIAASTHFPLYMQAPANSWVTQYTTLEPDDFSRGHNISLLRKFITTLDQLIIPILENAWDVVMYHLFTRDGNIPLCDIYREYIKEYLPLLTADFTQLSLQEMSAFFGDSRYLDYQKLNPRHLNGIFQSKKRSPIDPASLSRTTLCNVQRLMASEISISRENMFYPDFPLQSLSASEEPSQHMKLFIKNHTKNIYHYLHKYS
ncbi:MAG: hypothetical protein MRZ74_12860 [Blautia sp.]|nr:hypothetical protein [Blautia sp.]